jgi:hypothetical protein
MGAPHEPHVPHRHSPRPTPSVLRISLHRSSPHRSSSSHRSGVRTVPSSSAVLGPGHCPGSGHRQTAGSAREDAAPVSGLSYSDCLWRFATCRSACAGVAT